MASTSNTVSPDISASGISPQCFALADLSDAEIVFNLNYEQENHIRDNILEFLGAEEEQARGVITITVHRGNIFNDLLKYSVIPCKMQLLLLLENLYISCLSYWEFLPEHKNKWFLAYSNY